MAKMKVRVKEDGTLPMFALADKELARRVVRYIGSQNGERPPVSAVIRVALREFLDREEAKS